MAEATHSLHRISVQNAAVGECTACYVLAPDERIGWVGVPISRGEHTMLRVDPEAMAAMAGSARPGGGAC